MSRFALASVIAIALSSCWGGRFVYGAEQPTEQQVRTNAEIIELIRQRDEALVQLAVKAGEIAVLRHQLAEKPKPKEGEK